LPTKHHANIQQHESATLAPGTETWEFGLEQANCRLEEKVSLSPFYRY